MEKTKERVLKGLLYVLVTIALSMVLLFPVLLFLLPIVFVLNLFFQFLISQYPVGYLFQVRSVCKIE
ncbi:hypothetical protein [Aminipila sp.]|uniref:hypothetical protein n=1 Tax=Aminipila sp. TaxID=2060095 RepID=UPI00289BB273|nr:hypothetical protein [Aminipila sp.]